ncbi:hypothetical protein ACS8Y6_17695 [Salinisphaera sp. RV14]|uniref:hypothetical protein n=1 Tax=unclassified Salinisphaera TaxID=2649847 RepID=UPI003F84C1E0
MSWAEIGEAHAYLLRYRSVESRPRRRRHKGEARIAEILSDMDDADMEDFREMLMGQGLELMQFEDAQMPGIAPGGKMWMLARRSDVEPPQYFSRELILQRMAVRLGESRTATSVWYLHIWLLYLAVVYTDLGRGMTEVGEYLRARFPMSVLSDTVRTHCDQLQSSRPVDKDDEDVISILTDVQGQDIYRRVSNFCSAMVESGLLMEVERNDGEPIYQQTLLGALEIGRNYQAGVGLMEPGAEQLANVTNLARHHSDGETMSSEDEG